MSKSAKEGRYSYAWVAVILAVALARYVVGAELNTSTGSSDTVATTCGTDGDIPVMRLSNGVEMPVLAAGMAFLTVYDEEGDDMNGDGSFRGFFPEEAHRSMKLMLDAGWRHFDTAVMYRTHRPMGQVLGSFFASGQGKRSDIFLTTKVFHGPVPGYSTDFTVIDMDHMSPQEVGIAVRRHFETALIDLGVGYVDLLLLHWPASFESSSTSDDQGLNRARRLAAWKVLENMLSWGWARSIGVSNFSEIHLEQLKQDGATIVPMVNQLESSPYIRHDEIIKYCQNEGITVMAYSPMGRASSGLLQEPILQQIASNHGKNPGQVALRYQIQQGMGVVSLTTSPQRVLTNKDIFTADFSLTDEEMTQLASLQKLGQDGSWGLPSPYSMP
jgi:diketogulonate reductase-like aldo/keto reductase